MSSQTRKTARRIAIIGSGFSGLCVGIKLKQRGYEHFTIFEKADSLGGTWRDNTYPGAECDVASALYSFSFERNPNWTYKWSEQHEILKYMEHCASKYGLTPHIRYKENVLDLRFQEDSGTWRLETESGTVEEFDAVVSGVGQLHKPWRPEIEGADSFAGDLFHSARWNHDVSLKGKKVCCIGNAASALQFIPEIAKETEKLTVFQRSANWVIPKKDREYSDFEKKLVTLIPPLLLFYRFFLWFRGEVGVYPLMFMKSDKTREKLEQMTKDYINEKIRDPELREKLVPDYPMGAKRILFSDNYYEALDRDDVHVVTDAIDRIVAKGVVTKDGTLHEADVIVYATGFETTTFLTPMQVRGLGGEVLNETWAANGAEAYLGITHTGFPNFFMMYGPNTNLGHNSIIVMIEAQTRYLLSCLDRLDARDAQSLNVKRNVQRSYNTWVQDRLKDSVWANVDQCWYKDENGKITNNWVGRTTEYRKKTKSMNPDDYEFA
ncbi:MAG: NAD(P)/FAD-dependent oxidoreductase [Candidatus Hydrogenedentota bacterium]